MPIKAVQQDVADAINHLHDLLKREYKTDYSFSIMGEGMTLAQCNMYGIQLPVPIVENELKSIDKPKIAGRLFND